MKTEFHYVFKMNKMILFEVDYYTLGLNSSPYFTTSVCEFIRSKRDFKSCGQGQERLLKTFDTAYNFYKKWDVKHLGDLSEDEYNELLTDIERLKEKYKYMERFKEKDDKYFDRGFSFCEEVEFSKR